MGLRKVLPFLVLAAAVAAVFVNTLGGGLHLDDFYRIGDWRSGNGNPELERVWPLWRHFVDPGTSTTLPTLTQYRPLLPLSLSLSHALSDAVGLDRLVGLHLGNVAVHLAGACLLFLLIGELLRTSRVPEASTGGAAGQAGNGSPADQRGDRATALVAALLYAVHPVAGIPVNYLCARDLLLMQAFALLGLWLYVRLRRTGGGPVQWLLVLTCLALSLFSKTNSLVIPLIVLAYEMCFGPGLGRWVTWLRALPFAALSVGFYLFTEYGLNFSDYGQLKIDRPAWQYPLTQAREHLTHYLRNAVAPFWLRPLPLVEPAGGASEDFAVALSDLGVWAGALVIVASLVVAWRVRRSHPLAAFCVLSYWLWMALTTSVIPLRSLATDYRQVASLPYFILLLVLAGRAVLPSRATRPVAVVAVLVFAGISAFHHNPIWKTERSLWGHSVGVGNGGIARAHMNYGQSLSVSDPERAEKHLRIALEMTPGDVYSHINLGLVLVRQQRNEEGLASVRRAAQLAPRWAITRYWLGHTLERLGQSVEAAAEYAQAANLQSDHPNYLYQAARSAQAVGSFAASLEFLEQLHRDFGPRNDSLELERVARERGTAPFGVEAGTEDTLANSPDALYAAARRSQETGEFEVSLRHLDRLHALAGPTGDSLFLEGFARQSLGDRPAAIACYRAFLEREPNHVQVLFNLAYALMEEGEHEAALPGFSRVLELDPARNEVHHWLSVSYAALGRTAEAEAARQSYEAGR